MFLLFFNSGTTEKKIQPNSERCRVGDNYQLEADDVTLSSLECEKKAPQNMSNTITTEQQIFKCLCVVSNAMSSSYVVQKMLLTSFFLFFFFFVLSFVDDVLIVLMVSAMFLSGRIVFVIIFFLNQIRGWSHRMWQRDGSGRRSPRFQVQIIFDCFDVTCGFIFI